jgi:hypothetical protein
MDQYFRPVNRSHAALARRVLRLTFRIARRLLRILLRRPAIDVLLLLLVLFLIASLIGRVNRPRPILYEPPPAFEGR